MSGEDFLCYLTRLDLILSLLDLVMVLLFMVVMHGLYMVSYTATVTICRQHVEHTIVAWFVVYIFEFISAESSFKFSQEFHLNSVKHLRLTRFLFSLHC